MTSFRVLLIYREKQNHVKFRYLKTNKQQNPHKQVSLPCRFHSCCYSCSQSTLIKASPPTLGSCCRCLLLPVLVRFFFFPSLNAYLRALQITRSAQGMGCFISFTTIMENVGNTNCTFPVCWDCYKQRKPTLKGISMQAMHQMKIVLQAWITDLNLFFSPHPFL